MKKRKELSSQATIFIVSVFFCGIIAGTFSAINIPENSIGFKLANFYIENMKNMEINLSSFLKSVFNNFKYIILILISWKTPFSSVLIPIIVSFRGFLFAFSSYIVLSNLKFTALLPLIINGLPNILSISAIFLIAIIITQNQMINRHKIYKKDILLSMFLTLIATILQSFLSPILINFIK